MAIPELKVRNRNPRSVSQGKLIPPPALSTWRPLRRFASRSSASSSSLGNPAWVAPAIAILEREGRLKPALLAFTGKTKAGAAPEAMQRACPASGPRWFIASFLISCSTQPELPSSELSACSFREACRRSQRCCVVDLIKRKRSFREISPFHKSSPSCWCPCFSRARVVLSLSLSLSLLTKSQNAVKKTPRVEAKRCSPSAWGRQRRSKSIRWCFFHYCLCGCVATHTAATG